MRGRPRGKRGKGGGRRGGGRGARSSGGAGRRQWFGAGLARSARTHARWSVCPLGAGGRPGAESRGPRAQKGGAAVPAAGARGARAVTRRSCEGGRERASERARERGREGAAPAHARPAPTAPPARPGAGGGRGRGRCRWPLCLAPRDGPRARRGAGRGRRALTSPAPWAAGGRRRCAQALPAETPRVGRPRGAVGGACGDGLQLPPGPSGGGRGAGGGRSGSGR